MKYEFKTIVEVTTRYNETRKLYIVNSACSASTAAEKIFGVKTRSTRRGIASEAYVTVDGTGYTIICTPYDAKMQNAKLVSPEFFAKLSADLESAEVLEVEA